LTSYTSAELTAILIQVVVALVVIRRSFAMARGVPYSPLRLAVLPALVLFLWGVSELESTLLTPWASPYLIGLDLAIVVATTISFARIAERATQVSSGESGSWSYQIGFSLAALFIGVFVVRLAIAVVWFPGALEFGKPPGGFPPVEQQIVLGFIDSLLSVGVGLLVGRSLGIRRKVEASRKAVGDSGVR
jgi:hypothetical protein